MCVGSSPIFRTKKERPHGGVLFWCGGERIPFRKGAVCALIKREGGTAKVPPSHIPFLAVVSGGGCVGLLGGRWRGAHRFLQRARNCPDGTRKTTLTVFFHTIFPSGGERFFVEAGCLFYWCKGERMDFYKGRGVFGGGRGWQGRNEMDFCSQNLRYLFANE